MIVRMEIDDEIMNKFKSELCVKTGADVVNNGLTILNWAIDEIKAGRLILSSDKEGSNIRRLAMPDFVNIKPNN